MREASGHSPVPAPGPVRLDVLEFCAARIPRPPDGARALVGVDGPDGAGKTIFADQLAATVRAGGRPVVRISLDDFHHTRSVRYRRGRDSPVGFWLDSYDYPRFVADVLDPLGPGGDGRYRSVAHDLASDEVLDPPWQLAAPASVVIVDGLFLHREELAGHWDFSIWLDVPFAETAARMSVRDGTAADPADPSMRRYVDAQRIYAAECAPATRASLVIDNSDVSAPRVRA